MPSTNRRQFLASSGAAATLAAAGATGCAAAAEADPTNLGRTPHTRFAVNVEMWWRKLDFLDRLRQAAAFGYPAVEWWPWREKNVDAIADLTGELGIETAQITAWGFKPGMNETKNHDAFVKEIEASCQVAKKLRTKLLTVVGGNDVPGMTQAEMHGNIIAALRRAAPIAEANDITLILEPMNIRVDHKGHCLYGSAPAIRICQEVGSPNVKINWDLYHMHISEGDLCGHLREGLPYIGYLQIADHPGRNEPGTGELRYNRVLREAYDLGYRGYVGLECRPKTTELAAAQGVAAADIW